LRIPRADGYKVRGNVMEDCRVSNQEFRMKVRKKVENR